MANRFTELEDNDNIVDAVNQLELEVSNALDGVDTAIGEPAAVIADSIGTEADNARAINAILAALRAKNIVAT